MSATFDREWTLSELLPCDLLTRIGPALRELLNGEASIIDETGSTLWGAQTSGACREPLVRELEPVGWLLSSTAERARLRAAAELLGVILRTENRYKMASHLHLEVVASDFDELKREHARVQESEARYKALSEELEQRVREQVALLDERQRQLYQAEKLASVGQLAAGVAHEVNNPLGFVRSNITSFGSYLESVAELKARIDDAASAWHELDLDFVVEDGRELLRDTIEGVDRIARIVRDLKGFSSVDRPEEEVIDLNENLRRVAAVAGNRLPPGITITLDLSPLPPLLCLPGHLNQVFLNLIQNAVQATQDRGHPAPVTIGSRPVARGLEVTIRDSGVGMSEEELERAFEPFFTTRPVGSGTGLGLTVARDIVLAHGGNIRLHSTPGEGSVATVFLPI